MIHSQLALSPVGVFQLALYRVCVCHICALRTSRCSADPRQSLNVCDQSLSRVCVCVGAVGFLSSGVIELPSVSSVIKAWRCSQSSPSQQIHQLIQASQI